MTDLVAANEEAAVSGVSVTAWKSRDVPIVDANPDLVLGRATAVEPMTAYAEGLHRAGARRVRLDDPVDLRSPAVCPSLLLIRDLNRYGIIVDWQLVLDAEAHDWRELSHLNPPRTLYAATGTGGGEDVAALVRWREEFHYCRFIVRKGPRFVQIRDRRWSRPRLMTISAPEPLALVLRLLDGTVDAPSAPPVAGDLEDLRLIQRIGDQLWMPAYRVWRWPMPAEFV